MKLARGQQSSVCLATSNALDDVQQASGNDMRAHSLDQHGVQLE